MSGRTKPILLLLLSLLLAVGGFVCLFKGNTNHMVAIGLSIFCFTAFYYAMSAAINAFESYKVHRGSRHGG